MPNATHLNYLIKHTLFPAMWIFISLLPVLFVNLEKQNKPLGFFDYFGTVVWVLGMLIEVVADYQKMSFRSNVANEVGEKFYISTS